MYAKEKMRQPIFVNNKTFYQCQYCSQNFSHRSNFQAHFRTHTGEKPYKCSYCSQAFTQYGTLQTHVRTHTGERPYKCDHCSRAFSQYSTLRNHIRTHTGEKPFQCSFCPQAFSRPHYLKAHMRNHTGEELHSNKVCCKDFISPSNFHAHISTHIRKTCSVCSEDFSDPSSAERHRLVCSHRPEIAQYSNDNSLLYRETSNEQEKFYSPTIRQVECNQIINNFHLSIDPVEQPERLHGSIGFESSQIAHAVNEHNSLHVRPMQQTAEIYPVNSNYLSHIANNYKDYDHPSFLNTINGYENLFAYPIQEECDQPLDLSINNRY